MKKLYIFLIMLFVPFMVKADHIYRDDMLVNIGIDGTAHIVETWKVKADDGSEWYKGFRNMRNMELSNFEVYMDGNLLQKKSNWDLNESLNEKAGYYGVHPVNGGFELCFGKSDFKKHTFTLKYDLSNMIFNTEDNQVLYFNFVPKITADNYSVVVDSYYYFPNDLGVWGYGAKGYVRVENGKIKMANNGNVIENYVTLLVKFPKGTFNTLNRYKEFVAFDDVFEAAEKGTYTYNDNKFSKYIFINIGLIIVIVWAALFIAMHKTILKSGYGYKDKKKINKNKVPLFREIPCNGDIYYASALLKLNNYFNDSKKIFGAILLKWVKEDKIKFIKNGDKNNSKIDLTKQFILGENDNPIEVKLYQMMYEASENGILEQKEFEKWNKKHYSLLTSILNEFDDVMIKKLKQEGHIYTRTNKKECKYENVMDDQLYRDSQELYGLKLFLKEFTKIQEKEVIEVKLWDEYLMFAYLFGLADKVAKQFQKFYPEIITDMQNVNVDFDTILCINSISTSSISASSSGGSSSGGGGGGASGSGGSSGGR